MKTPYKTLADCINTFTYHRICPEDCMDALLYMKLLKSITDACHENGIRSIFGIMLPNPEDAEASLDFRDFVVQNLQNMDNKEIRCSETDNKPLTLDEMRRMIDKPIFAYDLWYGGNFWHIIKDIDDKYIYFDGHESRWSIDEVFCDEPSHLYFTQERENA